jgi:hypothetical protein
MAYFQKDPAKAMAADIAGKTAERDTLIARLAAAEDAVVSATSAATQFAMSGSDDTVLDRAESKVLAARERVSTLKAALARLGATIIALENAYAEHKDKTIRRATARECEVMADDLEAVGRDINPILERMVAITQRASSAQVWDAVGLNTFVESSRGQIPAAIAALALALREHGLRTLDGREARPTLLTAPAPAATVNVVEPPVVRVFAAKNIAWTDAAGQRRTAGKYNDADLPPSVAKAALASGVCREIGSDIWRQWSGSKGFAHPDPSECEDLDIVADVVKADAAVIIDAKFERIDRGGPFEATILRKA